MQIKEVPSCPRIDSLDRIEALIFEVIGAEGFQYQVRYPQVGFDFDDGQIPQIMFWTMMGCAPTDDWDEPVGKFYQMVLPIEVYPN